MVFFFLIKFISLQRERGGDTGGVEGSVAVVGVSCCRRYGTSLALLITTGSIHTVFCSDFGILANGP